MEYKNIERARTKKIARKAKKVWTVTASIITGFIIFSVCLGVLLDLHETDSRITKSTRHRTGIPTEPEVTAMINSGRWSSLTMYPEIQSKGGYISNEVQWGLAVGEFYERTGVLVHFYIPDKIGYTKEEVKDIYVKVFDDADFKGPFFLYLSGKQSEPWGKQQEFVMGDKAAQFMDGEATRILMDSLENPWRYSNTDWRECWYATALKKAGERMMKPTVSRALPVGIGMLTAVVVIIVLIIIWSKKHRKDEETYNILNTPLEELAGNIEKNE